MKTLIITSLLAVTQIAAAQTAANVDAQVFRSIFTKLVDPKGAELEKVNHLIYAPALELVTNDDRALMSASGNCQVPSPADQGERIARQTLCEMQKRFGATDAKAFYEQGESLAKVAVDLKELNTNLKNQDLLIVVVPGVFGEFITGRAFEEVFENKGGKSAYAEQFKANFAKIAKDCTSSTISKDDPACDSRDLLAEVNSHNASGKHNVPMDKLMNVASLDNVADEPVTKVVLFQMQGFSFESLGKQEEKAEIFNRRLEKFFQIMGHTPKNIAFVGYSRGTAFTLEMLSQAKRDGKPWLNNVRSVVSLGGVVFGSALADDVFNNKSNPANCQLELVAMQKETLQELPEPNLGKLQGKNAAVYARNLSSWRRFALANAAVMSGKPCAQARNLDRSQITDKEVEEAIVAMIEAGAGQNTADPSFGIKMAVAQAANFGLIQDTSKMTPKQKLRAAADALLSTEYYNNNIRRFKRTVEAIVPAVQELTTDSRLQWFRTHTIPTAGIRYYSVSGTMADPKSDLVNNEFGYNPKSPDDIGLVKNWTDYTKAGHDNTLSAEYAGVSLNDSQVAVYKTMFWPNMIASLNSANAGIRYTPLAVVGTHHWGMALPIVTEVKEGTALPRNPFPRKELMRSIALSIAHDIRVDAEKGQ